MILQGKDLILSLNGHAIAGAKSCSLNVSCDTIKTSSATDGEWEHIIADMKSWSLSASRIFRVQTPSFKLKAMGTSNDNGRFQTAYIEVNGDKRMMHSRGLWVAQYSFQNGQLVRVSDELFDTYTYPIDMGMASYIGSMPNGSIVLIVSYDAISLNATNRQAIISNLGVPKNELAKVSQDRYSLACIGVKGSSGVACMKSDKGVPATTTLYLNYNGTPLDDAHIKNSVGMVGQEFDVSLNVDGFSLDELHGKALCTDFDVSGAIGSLMKGNFKFKGNGPLQ